MQNLGSAYELGTRTKEYCQMSMANPGLVVKHSHGPVPNPATNSDTDNVVTSSLTPNSGAICPYVLPAILEQQVTHWQQTERITVMTLPVSLRT
jgi:hypothetical protein